MRRLLVIILLLGAGEARAYTLLNGPMPLLSPARPPVAQADATIPAPRPDPDARAPAEPQGRGAVVSPGLIDRRAKTPGGSGFAPGSDYSEDLARRGGRPSTGIGTTLAPGLLLRAPLQ